MPLDQQAASELSVSVFEVLQELGPHQSEGSQPGTVLSSFLSYKNTKLFYLFIFLLLSPVCVA